MKCFYHSDMDGICSAAILNYSLDDDDICHFHRINYNDTFPFYLIDKHEVVYILDFSLQKPGEFEKLLEITKNVIWIDHHKTAIERHEKLSHLKGIRDISKAGCQLTWEYLFDTPSPQIVKYLEDYDLWKFKYGEDTNYIQQGIRLFPYDVLSSYWKEWFSGRGIEKIIDIGHTAVIVNKQKNAGLVKAWSFEVAFEGYKGVACNAGSVSSQLFDSIKDDYDIMIPFVWDGKQWTISLYTKKEIDVSEIAKKYGGGGHKQAAGFQCKELPWRKKDEDCEK